MVDYAQYDITLETEPKTICSFARLGKKPGDELIPMKKCTWGARTH